MNWDLDIIGKSKGLLIFAVFMVLLSWTAVFVFGLHPGIDLEGGTQWRVSFSDSELTTGQVESFMEEAYDFSVTAKTTGEGDFVLEFPASNEEEHQEYKDALIEEFGEMQERSFSSVGPVIGQELKDKSLWAILGVLLGIFTFVAWSFRKVSHPINSWKYGIVSILTLFHDVSLPIGIFALMGHLSGVEVNTKFIVAVLVILGFSVNDTIVVFDRIRENLLHSRGKKKDLKKIINNSVNETLMRSINTSITLILVLASMLVFGPSSLYYFILTILVGTIAGTYSSIFVASPGLYLWGREK